MSYGKKDVFFDGDYDAWNMRPQKSRDRCRRVDFVRFYRYVSKNWHFSYMLEDVRVSGHYFFEISVFLEKNKKGP